MTPVERVARALDDCWCKGDGSWPSLARAALSALLEPSEAMVLAGYEDTIRVGAADVREIWANMIRAALEEKP